MSRKPTSTDAEVDATFHEFQGRNGRAPTTLELRELLPGGISNDRASAARARAKKVEANTVHSSADPKPHDAAAPDGSPPARNELAGAIMAVLLGGQTEIDRVVDDWAKERETEMRAEIHTEVEASLNRLVQRFISAAFA